MHTEGVALLIERTLARLSPDNDDVVAVAVVGDCVEGAGAVDALFADVVAHGEGAR